MHLPTIVAFERLPIILRITFILNQCQYVNHLLQIATNALSFSNNLRPLLQEFGMVSQAVLLWLPVFHNQPL